MTAKRSVLSDEDQSVTFVELFFDLVFVFAITQLTGFVVEHLDWNGIGRAAVVFWLIWWAWTQFTWALNPADTTHPGVRAATLLATGVAFVMAASVKDAFGDDALWFAIPYVAVRLTGLGIYAAAGTVDAELMKAVRLFGSVSLTGLAAVMIGAVAPASARGWWWLAAILLDLVAAGVGGRGQTSVQWKVKHGHFCERYGLFVIIALGESLIVAGTTVIGAERTADLAVVSVAAVAITCLLWWTYFGWLHPALEHGLGRATDQRAPMARDAFSVLHFPLIGGVIGIAVAFEEAVAHPADHLHAEVTAALAIGLVLFLVAASAAHARVGSGFLVWRSLTAVGLAATLLILRDPTPTTAFLIVTAGLAVIVAAERGRARSSTPPSMHSGPDQSLFEPGEWGSNRTTP